MKNRWESQLDEITQSVENSFGSLDQEQLNQKPDAETWSIAQNLHHLIVLNETYFPVLDSLRNGTYTLPFTARFNFAVKFFGSMLLKYNQPESKMKLKTMSLWRPNEDSVINNVIERFKNHQEELKQQIRNSLYLIEQGTIISSPGSKFVVYKLETAFDILVTHERRHLVQAQRVKAALLKE